MRSRTILDQHTLIELCAVVFSLHFYVIKYRARRDDALPGSILCNSPLVFVIRVPSKLGIVFSSPDCASNKNACTWLWGVFEYSYVGYDFCFGIVHL